MTAKVNESWQGNEKQKQNKGCTSPVRVGNNERWWDIRTDVVS